MDREQLQWNLRIYQYNDSAHVVCVQHLPSGSLGLQMLGDDLVAEPDVVASEEIMEAKLH